MSGRKEGFGERVTYFGMGRVRRDSSRSPLITTMQQGKSSKEEQDSIELEFNQSRPRR